jgi:hypothetical protein
MAQCSSRNRVCFMLCLSPIPASRSIQWLQQMFVFFYLIPEPEPVSKTFFKLNIRRIHSDICVHLQMLIANHSPSCQFYVMYFPARFIAMVKKKRMIMCVETSSNVQFHCSFLWYLMSVQLVLLM